MRKKYLTTATLMCSAFVLAAAPMVADAQTRHRVKVCRSTSSAHNTRGTVIGAVAGGLLGNAVSSGGGKTGGTLIGAGAGAVAGHEIAKHRKCHYVYR